MTDDDIMRAIIRIRQKGVCVDDNIMRLEHIWTNFRDPSVWEMWSEDRSYYIRLNGPTLKNKTQVTKMVGDPMDDIVWLKLKYGGAFGR
jgi:hypothetical protein